MRTEIAENRFIVGVFIVFIVFIDSIQNIIFVIQRVHPAASPLKVSGFGGNHIAVYRIYQQAVLNVVFTVIIILFFIYFFDLIIGIVFNPVFLRITQEGELI